MLIRPQIQMIGGLHQGIAYFLVKTWCHGTLRSNILFLIHLQKLNIEVLQTLWRN